MPLIRFSREFMAFVVSDNKLAVALSEVLSEATYLGSTSDGDPSPHPNTVIYLISAEGFEPGEYFLETCVESFMYNDEINYTVKLKRI